MRVLVSWTILALALAGGSPVWAESGEAGDGSVPEWAEDGRNEIAIFIGITDSR